MYSICSLASILSKVRKRIDGRAFLQFSFLPKHEGLAYSLRQANNV